MMVSHMSNPICRLDKFFSRQRPTSGFCIFLAEIVSWESKKQFVVLRSSTSRNIELWLILHVNLYEYKIFLLR